MKRNSKTSKTCIWGKIATMFGCGKFTFKHWLIIIWWNLSFCGLVANATLCISAIMVINFVLATICLIKKVPLPDIKELP